MTFRLLYSSDEYETNEAEQYKKKIFLSELKIKLLW